MAQCNDCAHLETFDTNKYGEAYCPVLRRYVDPYSSTCYYYTADISSGCFITTTMCNILGYEDDCQILTILRKFRDEYMMKKKEYILLLAEYNIVGPKISDSLLKDKEGYQTAKYIYNKYIYKCLQQINDNKFLDAINVYIEMVEYLKNKYNINNMQVDLSKLNLNQIIPEKIDKTFIKKLSKKICYYEEN